MRPMLLARLRVRPAVEAGLMLPTDAWLCT
jgi:hypothetical protein